MPSAYHGVAHQIDGVGLYVVNGGGILVEIVARHTVVGAASCQPHPERHARGHQGQRGSPPSTAVCGQATCHDALGLVVGAVVVHAEGKAALAGGCTKGQRLPVLQGCRYAELFAVEAYVGPIASAHDAPSLARLQRHDAGKEGRLVRGIVGQ